MALPAAPAGQPEGFTAGRQASPSPSPAGQAGPTAADAARPRPQPVRAIIGDGIRVPTMWCEFGTCGATYTHPEALGERDLRVWAMAAGWRYDALGRRACPDCAQHDPAFWTARPPAPAGGWRRAG
jgi:hypothetical protein